jgi:hypothetical protein
LTVNGNSTAGEKFWPRAMANDPVFVSVFMF